MRQIICRGKTINSDEWVEGYYVYCRKRHYILPTDICGFDERLYDWVEVIPETVGQCTGLQDKNDKKIFEGDIVECVSWNIFFSDSSGKTPEAMQRKMEVVFYNGAFKMKETMPHGLSPSHWDLIYDGDIKIIGNINDNHKLLKEQE